jgi:replicative DNA helicase
MHPTSDPSLEEILLSHCFTDPPLVEHKRLKPEVFTLPKHRSLYDTLLKLRQQGEPLTADAVAMEDADLQEVAKKLSLRRLGNVTSKTVIRKLLDMHQRRTMQDIAAHLNEAATASDDPEASMSEQLTRLMAQEDSGEVTERHVGDIDELVGIIEWRANNPGCIRGIPTGFPKLDKLIDGLHPGMMALAGRTSDGKSSLSMNISINVAEHLLETKDTRAIYYGSYEMNFIDMQLRMAAAKSGYDISLGGLTNQQKDVLTAALMSIRKLNIILDDKAHPNLDYVVNRLRKIHREKKLAMAVLDYAQLIRYQKSKGDRVGDLDMVSKTIQGLSRELDIPIIAVVMLRRPEKQFDKGRGKMIIPPPHTSDIKGCGSFEEDSQTVLMIYRDMEDNTKLIVGKNRRGPRDKEIDLAYAAPIFRFAEK